MRALKINALRCLKAAGVFRAVGATPWRRRRLAILMYHGVSIDDEHEWDPRLFVSPDRFRRSLEVIHDSGCRVMPLREAAERMYARDLPPRSVALTADDGNFDFGERAVPILEEFGYPTSLFVTTYYSGRPYPVFNPTLRYLLWKGRGRKASPAGLADGNDPISTDGTEHRRASCRRIRKFAARNDLSGEQKNGLLATLAERLGIDYGAFVASRKLSLLSPEELAALPRQLIDVQLHTHRHRTPRRAPRMIAEIEENRTSLRAALGNGRPFDHLCYPSGEYWLDHLDSMPEVGVELGVTCELGLASPDSHTLLLPRIGITNGFSPVVLEGWLSGTNGLVSRPTD